MITKTITAEFKVVRNMGDYNSIHIGLMATAEIEEGECPITAQEALFKQVKDTVRAEKNAIGAAQAVITETVYGLPKEVQDKLKPVINNRVTF